MLSELEWVLDSAYGVPRRRILAAVGALLTDGGFCFEDARRLNTALDLYRQGKGDLSDYLLGLQGETAGALGRPTPLIAACGVTPGLPSSDS